MAEIALALSAAVLGAMGFFGAAVAPTAFRVLGEETARPFIRAVFPRYFLILGSVTALAALVAAGGRHWIAMVILTVVAIGFAVANFVLMPMINRARDRGKEESFAALHQRSVQLNGAQALLLLVAIGLLALR